MDVCVCVCCCLYQNNIKVILYIPPHKQSALFVEPLSAGGPLLLFGVLVIHCAWIPGVCLFLCNPCLMLVVSLLARSALSTTTAHGGARHRRP